MPVPSQEPSLAPALELELELRPRLQHPLIPPLVSLYNDGKNEKREVGRKGWTAEDTEREILKVVKRRGREKMTEIRIARS